jgi:MFS family permease
MPGAVGLWALLVGSLVPMAGLFAMGPALPVMAADFSENPDAELLVQLIGGASGIAFALSSPAIGAMIGRIGYKRVYIVSLLVFALFGTLPALLDSLPLILATRVVLGVAIAGAMTAGLAGLGALPAEMRPRMFGRNAMIASVGAILVFPSVGALSEIGWRLPFFIHALALVIVPMAMALSSASGSMPARTIESALPRGQGLGVAPLLLVMAGFIGLTMYIGPMFAPFYLRSIGVTDPSLAALPLSAMSVASLMMTSVYGRLHARFGAHVLFALTLLLTGSGLLVAGLAQSLPLFIAAMFAVSCGLAIFAPNLNSHIAATSTNAARGIGWAMSAMFAVQVAFPFIARLISQAFGPDGVFLSFGASALLAGICAGAFGRSIRRRSVNVH